MTQLAWIAQMPRCPDNLDGLGGLRDLDGNSDGLDGNLAVLDGLQRLIYVIEEFIKRFAY